MVIIHLQGKKSVYLAPSENSKIFEQLEHWWREGTGMWSLGARVSPSGFLTCYIRMLLSLVPSGAVLEYQSVGLCAVTDRNLFLTVPEEI